MKQNELLAAVRAIRWSALDGAYGESSRVAAAFERLAGPGANVESDDWSAAFEGLAGPGANVESDDWSAAFDVFQSHVWHQGTVYPVTAVAVPLLVDLCRLHAERRSAGANALGELLAVYARSAAEHPPSAGAPTDPSVQAVLAAFAERGDDVLGWMLDGRLAPHAIAIAAMVPELAPRLDAKLETCAELSTDVYLVFFRRPTVPRWAVERAERDLLARADPGAAAVVLRHGRPTGDRLTAVERALPPAVAAPLGIRVADFVDAKTTFAGDLTPGTVLFAGPNMVSVKLPGRAVTLKWAGSGLAKDEVIRIGLSPHGEPRVVEARGVRRSIAAGGLVEES